MKNGNVKLALVLLLVAYAATGFGQQIYRPPDPPHPVPEKPADQSARAKLGLDQSSPDSPNSALVQSWAGMAQTSSIRPPDPHGAAGPSGIIATVNLRIAYHTKAGAYTWGPVSLSGAGGFWGGVGNTGSGNSDPRALYDPSTGRFFVIMQENTSANQAFLNLAVSKNSNPTTSGTGDWYFYRWNITEVSGGINYGSDYPGFGIDAQGVYVTFNMYPLPFGSGGFKNCQIIVIKKADVIAGIGTYWILYTADGSTIAFTLQPATVLGGTTPGNKVYFASISFLNNTTVKVWALADPLGTRTMSSTTVTVPNHGGYIDNAPQLGTATTVATLSPRTQGNAFWYAGEMWFCHTAGGGSGKSSVYYYDVNTNDYPTGVPTLGESGFIDGGTGVWTYQPSIGGNAFGDIALVYTQSSTSTYPAIMYTSRTNTASSFDSPQTLRASPAYTNSDRWGDYASVTADPVDNSFWLTHEWARTTGLHDWGTWWGNILIVSPLANHNPVTKSNNPGNYSFYEPYIYWSVVGLRGPAGNDYDLSVYSDPGYTNFLAGSYYVANYVDFVVIDHNHSPTGSYYPKVNLFSGGGAYTVEWEDSTEYLLMPGTYTRSVTWPAGSVVKVWDVWLQAGRQYLITTRSVAGSMDLDMALYKSNGAAYYAGRSSAVRTSATPTTGYERFTYTAPVDDWYGLVVWSNNTAGGSFNINVDEVFPLVNAVPQTRALNEETYRLNQQHIYWSVAGVRPATGDDYDIILYKDSLYQDYWAVSAYGGSTVDFVVGDHNHSPLGLHYPMVAYWSGPGGNFTVEWEDSTEILSVPGTTSTVTWAANDVVKVWDAYLSAGKTYKFVLTPVSGSVDVGIALYDSPSDTFYVGRSGAVRSADANGNGLGESFFYSAPDYDWRGLVVWANNAASGSFTITVYETDFAADLNVRDNCAHSTNLMFGTSAYATDVFDSGLDIYAPPAPPVGAFDARLRYGVNDFLTDIRHTMTNFRTWDVYFQPASACNPVTLSWTSSQLPATGSVRLRDALTGNLVNLDMRTASSYTDNLNLGHLQIIYSSQPTFNKTVALGWNLIATPNDPANHYYLSLFPSAIPGTLYWFNGTYVLRDSCDVGKGYWLRFSSGTTQPITGAYINSSAITMMNGWNMIGGTSCNLPLSAISDPGSIIIAGTLYYFDGTYRSSDTVKTGLGYWLRTRAAGTIYLNCTALPKPPPREIAELADLSTSPSLTITDASGASQMLHFGVALKDPSEMLSFSLPPPPPGGVFDARFEGDYRAIPSDAGRIQVQSANYPLTISAGNLPINGMEQYAIVEVLPNGDGATHVLAAGSQIRITNAEVKTLRLTKEQTLPLVFAVEQNYPNPFNPSTTITYAIPHDEHVVVEVYNTVGQKVRTVVDQTQRAGRYTALWQSDNDAGQKVGSGVYFYQVRAGGSSVVRKMLLMK